MTGSFAVKIRRKVIKQLSAIPRHLRLRIEIEIDRLAVNPYPHGCKKLAGDDGLWRIRVGDYRVIYAVSESIRIIEIHAVGHRQSIYKK